MNIFKQKKSLKQINESQKAKNSIKNSLIVKINLSDD